MRRFKSLLAAAAILLGVLAVGAPAVWAAGAFGIEKFETTFTPEPGVAANQAGSHPASMSVSMTFNSHKYEGLQLSEKEFIYPNVDVKNIQVALPAGVVANLQATTQKCTEAQLEIQNEDACPSASAVGIIQFNTPVFHGKNSRSPIYNMVPPPGVPGELGANIFGEGVILHIVGGVQTGGDYALTATVSNLPQAHLAAVYESTVTLWGNPSDPSHNRLRAGCASRDEQQKIQAEEEAEVYRRNGELRNLEIAESEYDCRTPASSTPLLTLPSSCTGEPLLSSLNAESWPVSLDGVEEAHPVTAKETSESPPVTGCGPVPFTPALTAQPETTVAEAPTGLAVDIKIPHEEALDTLSEADLKKVVVALPAGMAVSPSAANGLQACPRLMGKEPGKEEQEAKKEIVGINLESGQVANCPEASKLGEAEAVTPLLEAPVKGAVYLAQQESFEKSLIGLFLVLEGSGAVVKLGGTVALDPSTGQLTTTFDNNPQLPISDVKLKFFGGPRAALMTPSSCGQYTTTSQLTPWSSSTAVEWLSSFTIDQGCSHGFSPSFTAGTSISQAGAYSPFTLALSRNDGEQRLLGLSTTLPLGVSAKLAGVPLCGEAQANTGACPAASQIGTVTAVAGPGTDPVSVPGTVYLTGPYNGGPFGISVEVPAIAGPFNLDENAKPVVVRGSIRINPATAQATIVTNPFPVMLRGIPLDERAVDVTVNRAGFTFNATNCQPESVTGAVSSTEGSNVAVSSPYQATSCASLPFKPAFTASTQGRASKASGASLTVRVAQATGSANIQKVDLQLPIALPARLTTLQKACTEAQFNSNPAGCPAGSMIGTARAVTPLLNAPLEGPAILVSHGGAAFPDVEFVLQGEGVTVVIDGGTQIKKGITYSKFETVPDAPISSFETKLPEGPHSVLGTDLPLSAKYDFCGRALTMPTTITAQNGAVVKQTTKISVSGCPPVPGRGKVKQTVKKKKTVKKQSKRAAKSNTGGKR